MRHLEYALAIALLGLVLSATPAMAKKDKGVPPGHAKVAKVVGGPAHRSVQPQRSMSFSASDGAVIRAYFAGQPMPWTALPPGIAKNYARGKPLPPGIAKKMLPSALTSQLPYRPGYEYSQVGRDIVLIETTTRLVADIIENVFD